MPHEGGSGCGDINNNGGSSSDGERRIKVPAGTLIVTHKCMDVASHPYFLGQKEMGVLLKSKAWLS